MVFKKYKINDKIKKALRLCSWCEEGDLNPYWLCQLPPQSSVSTIPPPSLTFVSIANYIEIFKIFFKELYEN